MHSDDASESRARLSSLHLTSKGSGRNRPLLALLSAATFSERALGRPPCFTLSVPLATILTMPMQKYYKSLHENACRCKTSTNPRTKTHADANIVLNIAPAARGRADGLLTGSSRQPPLGSRNVRKSLGKTCVMTMPMRN